MLYSLDIWPFAIKCPLFTAGSNILKRAGPKKMRPRAVNTTLETDATE
jgi:hypothetical protein